MSRVYNFGAGPAMLPEPVMRRAREEFLDWGGTGISVLEMGHRSAEFRGIAERAEADLRTLMGIPEHYRVLFLHGGASPQFAMVPMNLLRGKEKADYLHTGYWSGKAIAEARRFCRVNLAASGEEYGFLSIPIPERWQLDPEAAYLYYTANETITGVEFQEVPEATVPLVADMTSNILSRPVPVERFGLIFAGAQKNISTAGLGVVIVREELLGQLADHHPSLCDYALHAEKGSMVNTPPTYAWYLAGLTFQWLLEQGGLEEMERRNREKADLLYRAIDDSDLYINDVDPACRSRMNVSFRLAEESLNERFLEQAKERGLLALKGHRSLGGMRASLYNAMPLAGVRALVAFLREFERGA